MLSRFEQETIINFNKGEDEASVFTYEGTWQRHLEKKMGLKPIYDNGKGGREYLLPKSRIKMPRSPRILSPTAKKQKIEALKKARASLRRQG